MTVYVLLKSEINETDLLTITKTIKKCKDYATTLLGDSRYDWSFGGWIMYWKQSTEDQTLTKTRWVCQMQQCTLRIEEWEVT